MGGHVHGGGDVRPVKFLFVLLGSQTEGGGGGGS